MDTEFNRWTVIRLVLGSVVWAVLMGLMSVGLERALGVHEFWLLFPSSAILASLALYAMRIPNVYQGGVVRETRVGVWLLQQVATWGLICLMLRFFQVR